MRRIIAGLMLAGAATPVTADVTNGKWTAGYQMGTAWFSIGAQGSAGWLSLQCTQADDSASILSEIVGARPRARSFLTLTTTAPGGVRTHRFAIDTRGDVPVRAKSPAFLALWNDLRRGGTVTMRYADGRSWTTSLDGAGKTLTPGGCVD